MNEKQVLFTDSPCPVCGVMLVASIFYKRKERGNMLEMKCRRCYRQSQNFFETRIRDSETGLVCYPWRGEMDYDRMVCLNDAGEAIYLGERICGHADCVNEDHVIVKVPGTWRRANRGELKHRRRVKAVK